MDKDQLSFSSMEEYVIVCQPQGTNEKYYYSNELQHGSHWTESIQQAIRIPGKQKERFSGLLNDLTKVTNDNIAHYKEVQDKFKQKRDDVYQQYYQVFKNDANADPQKYIDKLDDLGPKLNRQLGKLPYLPPVKAGKVPSEVTVTLEQI